MPAGSFADAYLGYLGDQGMGSADYFLEAAGLDEKARRFGWSGAVTRNQRVQRHADVTAANRANQAVKLLRRAMPLVFPHPQTAVAVEAALMILVVIARVVGKIEIIVDRL